MTRPSSIQAGRGPAAAVAGVAAMSLVSCPTASRSTRTSCATSTPPVMAAACSVATFPTVRRRMGLRSLTKCGDWAIRISSRAG